MISDLMLKAYCFLSSLRGQRGVVGFEYLLVLGFVSVSVVVAMIAFGPKSLVIAVCGAINNIAEPTGVSALTMTCPTP